MSEFRRAYDMLRGYVNHEWDRIRSIDLDRAWDELRTPAKGDQGEEETEETIVIKVDAKQAACEILGVTADASYDEIKKAFERLNKRSNPANFPAGSEEAGNAAKIQVRVNWAYRTLTAEQSDTEKRFKSLEID